MNNFLRNVFLAEARQQFYCFIRKGIFCSVFCGQCPLELSQPPGIFLWKLSIAPAPRHHCHLAVGLNNTETWGGGGIDKYFTVLAHIP
jgi:hypothetical protein